MHPYPGRPAFVFSLALTARHWAEVLDCDARRLIMARVVDLVLYRHRFALLAFVFLPFRAHLVVAQHGQKSPSWVLQTLKFESAKALRVQMKREHHPDLAGQHLYNGNVCFWRRTDRRINPELPVLDGELESMIAWVHFMPESWGLCRDQRDWRWSSVSYYAEAEPVASAVRPGLPRVHPVRRDPANWGER